MYIVFRWLLRDTKIQGKKTKIFLGKDARRQFFEDVVKLAVSFFFRLIDEWSIFICSTK